MPSIYNRPCGHWGMDKAAEYRRGVLLPRGEDE
jgi:hypothetical protein